MSSLSPHFLLLVLTAAGTATATAAAPFQRDEVIDYEVRWKPPLFFLPGIYAGYTRMQVHPEATYEGKPAFHFTASAKSDGLFSRLGGINIDDSFDSIVSADNFCARRVVKIQREGKRKRDIEITFDPAGQSTHIVETDASLTPPRVIRNETLPLPSCSVDVVSVFYAARRFDLEVGKSFNLFLSDNGTTRPITITVEARENVDTGEGTVPALRIQTGSAIGLFSRGGTFLIWYSDDELKVPVKFEAKLRLGKVYGWLKSYQGKSRLRVLDPGR